LHTSKPLTFNYLQKIPKMANQLGAVTETQILKGVGLYQSCPGSRTTG
jgi:hypothetical protein